MITEPLPFDSLYAHGFLRVAVATPMVALASPRDNARATIELASEANEENAAVVVFPELGLSGYAIDDLHFQDALLAAVEDAIAEILAASRSLALVIVVGAPLRFAATLFNCALVIHRGTVLGVVPKSYLPNYREFYEKRQFNSAGSSLHRTVRLLGLEIPFGNDLLFEAEAIRGFSVHVEICEDLWAPIPPSSYAALAGATVLANLSASNATIGKSAYRRLLCASQSGRCVAAYLYSGAGFGESTTDLAWDGDAFIYENGELIAEGDRFPARPRLVIGDVDLDRLLQERARVTSLNDCTAVHMGELNRVRHISLPFDPPRQVVVLRRPVARYPFVPSDLVTRDARCREICDIQVQALAQRLRASGIRKVVIGVSGGLDSAHALLVTAKTFDWLGFSRTSILAYTLPGFATGLRSRGAALALIHSLGATAGEIDIRPSSQQMLRDIRHPAAAGDPLYDKVFENVQAGERSSHLFRLANRYGGLVIGTSDLSELALGYTTYGVGDQMAHYSINASVPKTLIRHLVHWAAASGSFGGDTAEILRKILGQPASPELVPQVAADQLQRAEDEVGPYGLQDFNLYYLSRYGYRPSKVAFLALHAWEDSDKGDWPEGIPAEEKRGYDIAAIKACLEVFLLRFIETSQFMRSALPNGPKVGSGGSLSPRGDWRAPSDAKARAWLEELRHNVP
jgi:NAD+ synthase (glutamine-hydrolysing)